MKSTLEILPNEIFHDIFSYFSWNEILISFWSLNQRINSIIGSVFSTGKTGIIFNESAVSCKTFTSTLLPLIQNSLFLSSTIKYMHFNGNSSIPFDLICQDLFSNYAKQKITFPNLKSFYMKSCLLSKPLIETLSLLIQHQLNELTLIFDEETYQMLSRDRASASMVADIETLKTMFEQFLCQIFSQQCQLTYLTLDISDLYGNINQCLKSSSDFRLNINADGSQFYCLTLRHIKIRLNYTCFLEDLIERVPNLVQLSIDCKNLERHYGFSDGDVQNLLRSHGNWFNKIPKLEVFVLKCWIHNDSQVYYVKWLLNNVNYVKKLEIQLNIYMTSKTNQTIHKSVIDSSFVRQYCLPDQIINLKYFSFYLRIEKKLLSNDIEKLINSFQIDPFFIHHEWTNIKCFYDEKHSYQHIFLSNNDTFQFTYSLMNHLFICDWLKSHHHIGLDLDSSIGSFLEQFDKICPHVSSVTIYRRRLFDESIMNLLLTTIPFEMKQRNLYNNQFRNVTKLQFAAKCHHREVRILDKLTDVNEAHAKIFSHIISMTVQLKYLSIESLEWLLYIIHESFDDLTVNALSTVQHAEFRIPSCTFGPNDSIHIGKHLVPVLSTFMPNLQTLRLWRSDDFPWTSIRPDFPPSPLYGYFIQKWVKKLLTNELLIQHVNLLESNLCHLFDQLKRLVYLEINGRIHFNKVEPYRVMAKNRFPNSRIDVHVWKFRLWI